VKKLRPTFLLLICSLLWAGNAMAVPETSSVRITDVTTTSFAVVWMTDVAADPAVQIFRDGSGGQEITGFVRQTPMPDASAATAASAREKGLMKVRVAGLEPGVTYHVRTVTQDPQRPDSIAYSSLREVTTAMRVEPFHRDGQGYLAPLANDLTTFRIYIRPSDAATMPAQGDLLLLSTPDSPYPLSSFAGEGIPAPEGVLDLNNLFGLDRRSMPILGGEHAILRIYRGGGLTTHLHYRRFPAPTGIIGVSTPLRGFFADINLDGRVDEADFAVFREQYRLRADDGGFNPDFNFVAVQEGEIEAADRIDARDFAAFASQYGRTGIE
jgi:hypothetical protein